MSASKLELLLKDVRDSIKFYSSNPMEDMSSLEQKITELCKLEISCPNEMELFKNALPDLINSINHLEKVVHQKLSVTNAPAARGYSVYKKMATTED